LSRPNAATPAGICLRYRDLVSSPSFDADTAAAAVMAAMAPLADAARARQASRYLKSDLDFLGVSVPDIRSAVTGTARRPGR
jgi:hypothetical protein